MARRTLSAAVILVSLLAWPSVAVSPAPAAVASPAPGPAVAPVAAPPVASFPPATSRPPTVPDAPPPSAPPREEPRVAVLIYHDVQLEPAGPYTVTPGRLAADLRWFLDHGWRPLTLETFRDWMYGGVELAGDWFLLTFDDGYLGWAEHGYPVLRELGVPAVQFLLTGHLGQANPSGGPPFMSGAQVAAMAADSLVTFADHTYDLHGEVSGSPVIGQVSGKAVAKDLDRSRAILAGLTGAPPIALAWPFGATTPAAGEVAAARYDLVFLAEDGFARRGEPHAIRRFGLDWRDPSQLPALFAPR
ncbi:MAG TPA: polysaccharide deacetylase family protein [Bacillota bacterium]|nr:polysaccharide deacetylase family protein [Bacillota bacterium]